ncbi:MAG TPA: metallohydrolase [Gammaproteobacteria bacterium]|nr:metallohydrolase [Gammaproteobacteria bacterium]
MNASITFSPVNNGDMTLVELESGRTILIDTNIRAAADDPDDPTRDVAQGLRDRLKRDDQGRLYVDVFLLSHPDQDHCSGLDNHFHLGKPEDHTGDKIFIREIWSSPLIFRRASKNHTLYPDAKKFNTEAKRRVIRYRESGLSVTDGDRIQILGRDENGKTDDLTGILVEVDGLIDKVNGYYDTGMSARLLGPLPKSDDECEEEALAKNRSSVILQFTITAAGGSCRFLTGGDAEVAIWERLWERHRNRTHWLEYDILLSPHHCSWHSLSYDSWSEQGEDAEVSKNARSALSQALSGANIVASSKPVKDDDSDPPCIRAKREYEDILKPVTGEFRCTGEYPSEGKPAPMEYEVGRNGLALKSAALAAPAIISSSAVGGEPLPHG